MPAEMDQICCILDKLTLDALTMMEEEIQLKLNIENSMSEGESHLAKARYIMGTSNVSALQLPTANSPEIEALATVSSTEDDKLFGQKTFDLVMKKKFDVELGENFHNPINWFGVLVPQTLHQAQAKFRQALLWSVQAVNIKTKLHETLAIIGQLKEIKAVVPLQEE